jgi:heme A synthase
MTSGRLWALIGGILLAALFFFAWRFEDENARETPAHAVTR